MSETSINISKNRFLIFLSIGAFDTLLDAGIFTILIYIFGIGTERIIILNILSFSIVVICAFFLNGIITFKDKNLTFKKLVSYYLTSSVGMIINTIIVFSLMRVSGFGTVVSKIIAACVVAIYNYTMCKSYIFKEN